MAGLILSNRLQRLQQATEGFGDTISSIRDTQRRNKLQDDALKKEEEERQLRMASERQRQQAGAQALSLGELQLQGAQTAARDQADVRQLTQQAVNVDSGLPQFPVPMLREKAPVEGSQYSQYLGAGAAGADAAESQALKDRLLAKIETIQTGKPVSPKDLVAKREMANEERKRNEMLFGLDLESKKAQTAKTKADTKKTLFEADKIAKEIAAMNAGPGGLSKNLNKDNKDLWDKIWSGYRTDTKPVKDSLGQIRKLESLVNSVATGASDIATLYTFIRSFDSPNSAVREAEAQMGQEAAGALQKLMNMPANLKRGRILPDTVRDEMLGAVRLIQADHERNLGYLDKRYAGLAEAANLDPSLVVDGDFVNAMKSPTNPGAMGGAGGTPRIQGESDYAALPPGAEYYDPNGNLRRKK